MKDDIIIKGARENNLKNIDVVIPRNKLVVLTGVSGSGKSTLAFDTIFAEGQRRYIESLSSYARQFLGQMKKPEVDYISGLSPAISIDQKTTSRNPRSTVGTVTEIYDYLRLLYSHIGVPYCPHCNKPISTQTIDEIIDRIKEIGENSKIVILSPLFKGKKGRFEKELEALRKDGFARVKIDGNIVDLSEDINLDKNLKHNIYLVVDRLILKSDNDKRLYDSVETALAKSNGVILIECDDKEYLYSTTHSCDECGYSLEEIAPRLFSFNSPFGACPECLGLGYKESIDLDKIVIWDKTLFNGGIVASGWSYDAKMASMFYNGEAKKYNCDVKSKIKDLPKEMLNEILYGTKGEKITVEYIFKGEEKTGNFAFEGIIPNLERRYKESTSEYAKKEIGKLLVTLECPVCNGKRLKQDALAVRINNINIFQLCEMSVENIKNFISNIKVKPNLEVVTNPILKEINSRLQFLIDVGLEYLSLNRMAGTLSGGEAQRIRLATQIGSGLTGVLYILDEPSIGLHQHDNKNLINTLLHLRDLGNTVIVVEHDEDTMRAADYIIDIGPYAGVNGGQVVACGTTNEIINNKNSITGKYLSGELKIEMPECRRLPKGFIKLVGCSHNNLKNVSVDIPLGVLTLVTGVSGSGKSSLINETLYPYVYNKINKSDLPQGNVKSIEGLELIDKVINIDQSPIGKTPRSNPATYTNVFTDIRELFCKTADAKERGFTSGRFSFNIPGGRCENCMGGGINKVEMYFLPDVYVKCDVCNGKRYNRETLEVKYKGKSIADILDMTISDANEFFENVPKIKNKIQALVDVGLGYIKLGQSATELSGGEAQRVKLATELSRRSTGKTLYVLDEPTTGLSMYDIDKLLKILQKLVNAGNSVIVIEHNVEVIKCADYIIDMGPFGGDRGGKVIAFGTPEDVKKQAKGYTYLYL